MKALTAIVIFSFLALYAAQTPVKMYATARNGAEIIDIDATGLALAYAANLQMDQSFVEIDDQTLFFTADRGSPNLYHAHFSKITAGPHSFYSTGRSPLEGSAAAPYLSFDVFRGTFIGPAFPNNNSASARGSAFAIQTAVVGVGSGVVVEQVAYEGYNFVAALIDNVADPVTGRNYVYFAGWSTTNSQSPFVIARGTVTLHSDVPNLVIDINKDVLAIQLNSPCFDQYDEINRPHLNITHDRSSLVLIVPGRCSIFAKVTLPPSNSPLSFGQIPPSDIKRWDPVEGKTTTTYLSSAILDTDNAVIYYTVKTYHAPSAELYSLNVPSWTKNTASASLGLAESETIAVLGNEMKAGKLVKYIFIVASGADRVERFVVNDDYSFQSMSTAVLASDINHISAAYYFYPHIYFSTFEPNAKLVRIPLSNFCLAWCGLNGFCTQGVCQCQDGYTPDTTNPDHPCTPTPLVRTELLEKQSQGAAAALGVLFAFSLLAAIAGWFLWWKGRSTNYTAV